MIFCDSHLHTDFSTDSETPVETQLMRAIELGLKHMYFTDHMDVDFPGGGFVFDIEPYFEKLLPLQRAFSGKIGIHIGVELGIRPEESIVEKNVNIARCYPFDYIIGSVHVVDGYDPYYPEYWESHGEENGIYRYYESMYDSMKLFSDFDSLGHIDYILRYCPSKGEVLEKNSKLQKKLEELTASILELLVFDQKALELNTAGWKYGMKYPHPAPGLLKLYKQLGGKMITIGSDAHKPEHMAWDFSRVPDYLRENGFTHYVRFENHKPIFVSI